MVNAKIDFIPFSFCQEDERYVTEFYRLCKDQERKLFDLTRNTSDMVELIRMCLEQPNSIYIAAVEDNDICGIFSLEDIKYYGDFILEADQHCIFARHCWGKKAREIVSQYFQYLDDNLKPIKRLVAAVPQQNFGVIKLLKDVGFKLEGTLEGKLIYPDKNGRPKFYNQLIYSKVNKEIEIE